MSTDPTTNLLGRTIGAQRYRHVDGPSSRHAGALRRPDQRTTTRSSPGMLSTSPTPSPVQADDLDRLPSPSWPGGVGPGQPALADREPGAAPGRRRGAVGLVERAGSGSTPEQAQPADRRVVGVRRPRPRTTSPVSSQRTSKSATGPSTTTRRRVGCRARRRRAATDSAVRSDRGAVGRAPTSRGRRRRRLDGAGPRRRRARPRRVDGRAPQAAGRAARLGRRSAGSMVRDRRRPRSPGPRGRRGRLTDDRVAGPRGEDADGRHPSARRASVSPDLPDVDVRARGAVGRPGREGEPRAVRREGGRLADDSMPLAIAMRRGGVGSGLELGRGSMAVDSARRLGSRARRTASARRTALGRWLGVVGLGVRRRGVGARGRGRVGRAPWSAVAPRPAGVGSASAGTTTTSCWPPAPSSTDDDGLLGRRTDDVLRLGRRGPGAGRRRRRAARSPAPRPGRPRRPRRRRTPACRPPSGKPADVAGADGERRRLRASARRCRRPRTPRRAALGPGSAADDASRPPTRPDDDGADADDDGDDGKPGERPERDAADRASAGAGRRGGPTRLRARSRRRSAPTGRAAARAASRSAAQRAPVGFVRLGDGRAVGAAGEVLVEPGRLGRSSGPSRRSAARARARSCGAASGPAAADPAKRVIGRPSPRAAYRGVAARPRRPASASRSAASAWRRLSRARVRRARAATWLTPSAAASSRPVRSWSSASSSAARWRSGIRASARCRSPDRRASIARCSADGAAPRDSPVHGRKRTILRRRISSRATRWAIWYSQARAFSGFSSVS